MTDGIRWFRQTLHYSTISYRSSRLTGRKIDVAWVVAGFLCLLYYAETTLPLINTSTSLHLHHNISYFEIDRVVGPPLLPGITHIITTKKEVAQESNRGRKLKWNQTEQASHAATLLFDGPFFWFTTRVFNS